MSSSIIKNLPNAADLVKMESGDLAGYVLEHLHSLSANQLNQASSHNVSLWIAPLYTSHRDDIQQAIYRACEWLIRNEYLEKKNDQGFFTLTQKGKSIKTARDFKTQSTQASAAQRASSKPTEETSENYDEGAVFPEHLIDKMLVGRFHVIEVDDIKTEADLQKLVKHLYDYPERSFYYFEEKDGPQNQLIRTAQQHGEILIEEYEKHYYHHPNFKRDYLKIYSPDGHYPFDWEEEVVERGPMFIRFTLRLPERKRRELEIAQRIETERNAASLNLKASNGKESLDISAERAERLYKEIRASYHETATMSREKARLILEKIEDAIKEFGNTNQEKKVELRDIKGQLEDILPPETVDSLKARATKKLFQRIYPKHSKGRSIFIGLTLTAMAVLLSYGLIVELPNLFKRISTTKLRADEHDAARPRETPKGEGLVPPGRLLVASPFRVRLDDCTSRSCDVELFLRGYDPKGRLRYDARGRFDNWITGQYRDTVFNTTDKIYFEANERVSFQLYCRFGQGPMLVGEGEELDWKAWNEGGTPGYASWLSCGNNDFKSSVGIGVGIATVRVNEPAVKKDTGPPVR